MSTAFTTLPNVPSPTVLMILSINRIEDRGDARNEFFRSFFGCIQNLKIKVIKEEERARKKEIVNLN